MTSTMGPASTSATRMIFRPIRTAIHPINIVLKEGFCCQTPLHELIHWLDFPLQWTQGSEDKASDWAVNKYVDYHCDEYNMGDFPPVGIAAAGAR